jgi:hypothetical protein
MQIDQIPLDRFSVSKANLREGKCKLTTAPGGHF